MENINVLYIDDDHLNISTYGNYIRDEGFNLFSISNLPYDINEYINFIKNNNIHAVIVDDYFEKQGLPYKGIDIINILQGCNVYICFFPINSDYKPLTNVNKHLCRLDFSNEYKNLFKDIKEFYIKNKGGGKYENNK